MISIYKGIQHKQTFTGTQKFKLMKLEIYFLNQKVMFLAVAITKFLPDLKKKKVYKLYGGNMTYFT